MKTILCALCVLCGATPSLFGRIGDTVGQIEKALGKPTRVWSDNRGKSYLFGPYNISIYFINGVSEAETFCKPDQSPIARAEIVKLLNLNAPRGLSWDRQSDNGSVHIWRSTDHKSLSAAYDERTRMLTIHSGKYADESNKKRQAQPTTARKLFRDEI